jgi:DNA-binding CsgD family transcriptional regulator/tetratricopeptide (TPR) repeat protein
LRRAVLVGRQGERAALAEAVEQARQGCGSSVFVVGEPGIGKSRLAAEVTDPAAAAGVRVLRGRAASVGAAVPFRPLSEALHSVLRQGPPQDAALEQYWPVLAGFDQGLPGYAAAPAEQSLVLRAEALLRMLSALGRESGCILLLEDLHDADAETLAVVDYLADHLAGAPVLLLVTLRPDPGPAYEAVNAATARRAASVLRLGRLTPEQTVELAADQLGTAAARVPAEVVARLHRDADGVPFVVEELLSAMVDSGHLVRRGAGWDVDQAVQTEVPATVTAAIRQRVQRLDDRCVALLEAAAVLGRRFATPLAASVVGLPPGGEFQPLREAAAAGFVVPDPGGDPDWYAFRHALTGEAILHRLLPGERAALSRRAAEAVEAGSAHVGEDWPQLAAELWLAGGEPRRAAGFFARAGRRATDSGALTTGVDLLERGLGLLDAAAGPPTVAIADILDDLVYALTLTGDTGRALTFGQRLVTVLATVAAPAERRAQAHLARARAAATGGQWELGLDEVAAAWRLVGPDAGPRIAAPLDAIAARLVLSGRQPDRIAKAIALAERALAAAAPSTGGGSEPPVDADPAARRLPAVACEALEVLGRCTRQHGFAAAEGYFTHALQIAERHSLTVWRIRALMELGVIDKLRYSGFERLEEARQAALDAGALVTACWADLQLSTVHMVRGDYDESMACADRVIDAATRLRLPELRAFATGSRAGIFAVQGRRAEMERALAECETEGSKFGYGMEVRACASGTCSLLSEDRETALAEFAKAGDEDLAVATLRASGYRGPSLLLRTVCGLTGRAEYEAFAASQFANVNWNQPFLHATHAVLLGRAGQPAAAAAAMAEAYRTAEALPMALNLVRRLAAEAALADGWGDPVGWLRAAEEFCHLHDLPRVAAACRALLRRAGATPRQRRAGSHAIPAELRQAGVTVREHEVLVLLADRLGNQAIAERLFLSPRTVEKHVSSLLTRTQQSDRAALVRLARRHTDPRVAVG